jgi:Protein of unknown function (DUF2726)
MTDAEFEFFKVLQQVVQDKYYIVPQVVMSDLLEVRGSGFEKKPYRTKIDKKTIDFVLYNKQRYTPYIAIELDDSTHLEQKRMARDIFVNTVLEKSGIKLIRIKNSTTYDFSDISKN